MTPHQQFWDWFKNQEGELFDFETNQEALFKGLGAQLQKVHPDLSFEIGPKCEGIREFVISASGMTAAFPAVRKLADVAPFFDRWKVTAFRPRRAFGNVITFRGKQVAPSEVQFSLLFNRKTIGIHLFIPNYDAGNFELKQIGYLLLDGALGEFDVESKVGLIKFFSPGENIPGERYPLSELRAKFDELNERMK